MFRSLSHSLSKMSTCRVICSLTDADPNQRAQDVKMVVLTSMRREDVASTSIRRHFGTISPLGAFVETDDVSKVSKKVDFI